MTIAPKSLVGIPRRAGCRVACEWQPGSGPDRRPARSRRVAGKVAQVIGPLRLTYERARWGPDGAPTPASFAPL